MKRVLPGILLAGFWLLLLLKGSPLQFWMVILVIAGIGAYEYVSMLSLQSVDPLQRGILVLLLAVPTIFLLPSVSAAFFPESIPPP